MNGQNEGPTSTSLIFPPQATTEGHIVELKTELKSEKKKKARLGLLSLLMGAFAVSGLLAAGYLLTNSDKRILEAQKTANANVVKLQGEVENLKGKLDFSESTIDNLQQQNAEYEIFRNIAETRLKIKQEQEKIVDLNREYFSNTRRENIPENVKKALDTTPSKWELGVEALNADNWSSTVSQQMTDELNRYTQNKNTIVNHLITKMDRANIKVSCTRENPFDKSKDPLCR